MVPLSRVATAVDLAWSDGIRSGSWQQSADTAVPMLPANAQEIFLLAMDPDVSTARIISLVSKDPVLAVRVVQLANSAFCASAYEITSINQAVVRVGTGLVRNVMTSTCMASLAADTHLYGHQGRQCIAHCIGTAYLASFVAEGAGETAAEAFLYGLLHDVGKLLLIKLAGEAHRYGVAPPGDDELAEVLTEQHSRVGAYLLRQWGLPARLMDPVLWHHEPDAAQERPQAAAVAYAANRLAHRYGVDCELDDFDPLADPHFARVGIDSAALAYIDLKAPGLLEMARHSKG